MKKKELLKRYDELVFKLDRHRLDFEKVKNQVTFLTFQLNPCPKGFTARFSGDGFNMICVKPDEVKPDEVKPDEEAF